MTSKYINRSSAQTELLTHFFNRLLDISMAMSKRHPHTWIGVNRALNVLSQISLPTSPPCPSSHEAGSPPSQLLKLQTSGTPVIPPFPSRAVSNLSGGPVSCTPQNITRLSSSPSTLTFLLRATPSLLGLLQESPCSFPVPCSPWTGLVQLERALRIKPDFLSRSTSPWIT